MIMGNNMDNQGRREGEAKPVLPNMRPRENPGGENDTKNDTDDTKNKVDKTISKK
jgi:hypothetical protein